MEGGVVRRWTSAASECEVELDGDSFVTKAASELFSADFLVYKSAGTSSGRRSNNCSAGRRVGIEERTGWRGSGSCELTSSAASFPPSRPLSLSF